MDQKQCDEIRRICGTSYAYLASPYTKFPGGIVKANSEACRAAARLMARGVPVFSPISHSHAISMTGEINPLNHSFWLKADEPFMRAAACLVVVKMPGWEDSVGVLMEMDAFDRMGKPIYYLDWDVTENDK